MNGMPSISRCEAKFDAAEERVPVFQSDVLMLVCFALETLNFFLGAQNTLTVHRTVNGTRRTNLSPNSGVSYISVVLWPASR